MKKVIAAILALVMILSFASCGAPGGSKPGSGDLMKHIKPAKVSGETVTIGGENAVAPTDFAVRLFQNSLDTEKNTMISPVSVLYALAMTANGAKGDTLAQMEKVLGMTVPEWNAYLKAYRTALPEGKKYELSIANSVWVTEDERFTVEQDFLQANADYYGADVFKVPFDERTLKQINTWGEEKTDGMVRNILNEIPEDAVMYLINAVAFDAEWKKIYEDTQIRNGVFTAEDGESRDVEMMHSEERYYLEDGNATGFMKPYADDKYAFVALLPKEGMSVAEYAEGLTGEGLQGMLAEPERIKVYAAMPKFESEYSVEMSNILADMGMPDAFSGNVADFSGLGQSTAGNIYINRVIHKTFISVDERGTKAGAVTVVEMKDEGAVMEETKSVVLNRPFVYLIVDCEANLPLFMGTVMEVEQ